MEQTEPAKSRLKVEMKLDRISNLQSDVMDRILSCMTLKEAARTSVLSSKWRNKWTMLSGLVFDDKYFSEEDCATLVSIVYHVLLSHNVPIEKFVLSHKHPIPHRDIDRWILHLSKYSIKVFELHIPSAGSSYEMPLCFFSYRDMIDLNLFRCYLRPPREFKGFKTLKRISFQNVRVAQDLLDMILCCPLLESLEIINCIGLGLRHLKIHAPNLRFLSFVGALKDVSLKNTLNLAVVHFNLSHIFEQDGDSSSNLAKFLVGLPHIQRLTIGGRAAKYLAVGDLPGRLPNPCLDLNFLSLTVVLYDPAEILTTLYLLRSSPNLEVLHVMVRHDEGMHLMFDKEAGSWLDKHKLEEDITRSFPYLRLVEITCFSGCKAELDFINFLLLNSLVLETMTIRALSAKGSSKVLKKLLQLRRTSSAEIIYLDP